MNALRKSTGGKDASTSVRLFLAPASAALYPCHFHCRLQSPPPLRLWSPLPFRPLQQQQHQQ